SPSEQYMVWLGRQPASLARAVDAKDTKPAQATNAAPHMRDSFCTRGSYTNVATLAPVNMNG
ncbi:MAG: hypothetical protein VXZ78_02105, partial [Pseudomonadota bacterium]|nr:hypothetical protein [Pseudomonadota bacterium]